MAREKGSQGPRKEGLFVQTREANKGGCWLQLLQRPEGDSSDPTNGRRQQRGSCVCKASRKHAEGRPKGSIVWETATTVSRSTLRPDRQEVRFVAEVVEETCEGVEG